MKEVTTSDFKTEVLDSQDIVLVDFFSIGCGPCRSMEPVLREAEGRNPNTKFVKIEASESDVFVDYKVSRVPTLVVFFHGKDVDRKVGVMSGEELDLWLKKKYEEEVKKND